MFNDKRQLIQIAFYLKNQFELVVNRLVLLYIKIKQSTELRIIILYYY